MVIKREEWALVNKKTGELFTFGDADEWGGTPDSIVTFCTRDEARDENRSLRDWNGDKRWALAKVSVTYSNIRKVR